MISLGLLRLHIQLPGCTSLKEKRSRLRPLIARLSREFNVSVAEVERLDAWQEAVLAIALVSNEAAHTQRCLQQAADWVEEHWPDVLVLAQRIELR